MKCNGNIKCIASRVRRIFALLLAMMMLCSVASAKSETFFDKLSRSDLETQLSLFNPEAMKRAINDLTAAWPERYPNGAALLKQVGIYAADLEKVREGVKKNDASAQTKAREILVFERDTLLANPLLDFDKILVLKRKFAGDGARKLGRGLGFPSLNSHTNDTIPHRGWDNEITVLSDLRGTGSFRTIYKSPNGEIVRDIDLEFDGDRVMFSSIDANDSWAIFEVKADGSDLKQLTSTQFKEVGYFDSCYLPDGRVITGSTAGLQGLPCENGGKPMVNLYLLDPKTQAMRQLTFEQDSDWHPAMLSNGRVLYLRWEYTDMMHYYSRILMSMNPDGTGQMEYWGSGSMFPTAFKHARLIPGSSRKLIGVLGGHHSTPETGRLAIIDPALNRKYPFRFRPTDKEWGKEGSYIDIHPDVLPAEETGFVQEIPGWGKDVVGNVVDGQGDRLKYNFVYPYALSEKYILVSMQTAKSLWGLYLVDVFDNMTLVNEVEDSVIFEPIPFRKVDRPPVLADRVDVTNKMARVFLTDIYEGIGLKGVPRGTVKNLRIFAYHYAYHKRGGHQSIGVESSWDVKRILGTVPVEDDGSASFMIPASTPVSLQPLDEDGASVQLMRSWLVGMPGENVSCVGCHEDQNGVSPNRITKAARRAPSQLKPFYGSTRPFAFEFEVMPVVEEYCVGCHNGKERPNGKKPRNMTTVKDAYANLNAYVRRPGPESDMEPLKAMEYHVSTSELVVMLKKGHHNVQLDREAWDRLYAWIDLNAPLKGNWDSPQEKQRLEIQKLYACIDDNPEEEYRVTAAAYANRAKPQPIMPVTLVPAKADTLSTAGFPFSAREADKMQSSLGATTREVALGDGLKIQLTRIPSGSFIMGSNDGALDEAPRSVTRIAKSFWMGAFEVTNAQYGLFNPAHDTRYIDEHGKDHSVPGYIANHPDQPVSRISWREAMAFCEWMSKKTGLKVTLPTEAQWEWAARAGSDKTFFFGDRNADFSTFANLADAARRNLFAQWDGGSKIHVRRPYPEKSIFPLRDDRFTDNYFIVDYVGQCKANAWGLKDIIGNVNEWTRSTYKSYPYSDTDGRNAIETIGKKVARGGSWHDRPKVTGSATRYVYEDWQKVFNVGFRVIIED